MKEVNTQNRIPLLIILNYLKREFESKHIYPALELINVLIPHRLDSTIKLVNCNQYDAIVVPH